MHSLQDCSKGQITFSFFFFFLLNLLLFLTGLIDIHTWTSTLCGYPGLMFLHLCGGDWDCVVGPVRRPMTAALVTDDLTWEQRHAHGWPSRISSWWTPGVRGLSTATTTRTHARVDRRRIDVFVFSLGFFLFCWFCFVFFYFKFCQSSPVFGELRPLVHFDGELLMVSFCCKDVSFLRGGAQAEIVMWVGHIIGLQGKHAVRCWCRHIVGRALEKRQSPSLTSGIHVRRDDLPDGWHWDKWHSHCFFLFYFFYIY